MRALRGAARARRALLALGLAIGLALGLCAPTWAHKASDAYATLADAPVPGGVAIHLSLVLKDLDAAVDTLDADNNRQLTWGEVRQAMPAVLEWVRAGVTARCDEAPLQPSWRFESLEQRSDGVYARLSATLACEPQGTLALDYRLMKDLDPTHRLLVAGTVEGHAVAGVLAPQGRSALALRGPGASPEADAMLALPKTGPAILVHFLPEGIHHIATGYDHLAFLLALLLPIVIWQRDRDRLMMDGHLRPGLKSLLTTVTGFTVGHSVTLVLATLGLIASPAWVEPAIALTIALSALLNLFPVRRVRSDVLALGFGLIHGLGFSNVMREAGVSGPLLPWALAGFNLGVEVGQLAGVALWCGAHLLLVRWSGYERYVVRGGSWALLVLALFWVVERVAGG
ncbi:MAG: HupE/UreJ family protein [Ramlibacter sp.]|nr:HupE/UreJ family protein [Ramlibacter sp.]